MSNIGVATGPSSLIVLDIDPRNGGVCSLRTLTNAVEPLPPTRTTLTGGGGHHYWFRADSIDWSWEGDLYRSADRDQVPGGKLGPGLDVQAAGHYVVTPPSRHASGLTYRWLDPAAPIAPAPDWLVNWPSTRDEIDFLDAA